MLHVCWLNLRTDASFGEKNIQGNAYKEGKVVVKEIKVQENDEAIENPLSASVCFLF